MNGKAWQARKRVSHAVLVILILSMMISFKVTRNSFMLHHDYLEGVRRDFTEFFATKDEAIIKPYRPESIPLADFKQHVEWLYRNRLSIVRD